MTTYTDQHSQYIADLFAEEDEALRAARDSLRQHDMPAVSIKPEEGRFLQLLTAAAGAQGN